MDSTGAGEAAADVGTGIILDAFADYQQRFHETTQRARVRFEQRDWLGIQHDSAERLGLREHFIRRTLVDLRTQLGDRIRDRTFWALMKDWFGHAVANLHDSELRETFFNSVTRRNLPIVGVDPRIEFCRSPSERRALPVDHSVYTVHSNGGSMEDIAATLLQATRLRGIRNLRAESILVANQIRAHLLHAGLRLERVEVLQPVFFRNKAAYVVGRLICDTRCVPLLIALLHTPQVGVVVDAVLLTQHLVGNVFSLTRSYFHVDVPWPRAVIGFLKTLMPQRRISELYMSLGYNKHGKTELYRELMAHLGESTDFFDVAPGARGMVMVVFTLPSFDIVFKVIRDRFPYPKTTSKDDVKERYQLVFKHDRAGRLVDAQEFEHLTFPRDRLTPGLLKELCESAAENVILSNTHVLIRHLYTERRLTPLDLYIRQAPPGAARAALLDYGQAIKDLAATNIFPGDLLLKNFGVNRSGRVVFYDYDELCLLTDCRFRDLPPPRDPDDDTRGEPWFYVDPHDIFPEELVPFLGLPAELKHAFLDTHGDLLCSRYWTQMQARHHAGEIMDIFPYPQSSRLARFPS